MIDFLELLYWRVLPHGWQDVVFYIGLAVLGVAVARCSWRLYAKALLRSEEP